MEIVSIIQEDMNDYGKSSNGLVFSAHVKITDVEGRAAEMIEIISNTSWLDELGPVEKVTFQARAKRSIIKIVGLILSRVDNEVTTEFGEFMISETAQSVLSQQLKHFKVPIAELLKEKITGNPGFDFHTESNARLIVFGEAKYSGVSNPHQKALKQIVEFIKLEKDSAELIIIKNFVSSDAVDNYLEGHKAYVAAFSITGKDPSSIIKKALSSDVMDTLLSFPEIYIIGIEVDA